MKFLNLVDDSQLDKDAKLPNYAKADKAYQKLAQKKIVYACIECILNEWNVFGANTQSLRATTDGKSLDQHVLDILKKVGSTIAFLEPDLAIKHMTGHCQEEMLLRVSCLTTKS